MKKTIAITFCSIVILICLIILFKVPSEFMVRLEPVTTTHPEYGTNPSVIIADERLFTMFAALNAAGLDREYPGLSMSPVRLEVRKTLAEKELPSLKKLGPIFDRVPDYQLVVWILQRGSPPEFERAEPGWWVTNRAANFIGLKEALSEFYEEAEIHDLWKKVRPAYQSEIEHLTPLVNQSFVDVLKYGNFNNLEFKQVVIIPNPLDSYYSGTGPQVGNIAYVVAGPTESDLNLKGLVEHELLHSIIGPMIDQKINIIPKSTSKRLYAKLKKTMPPSYGTWKSMLEETLNRAINLRMLDDNNLRAQQLDRLETEGYLLIKPFDHALENYEQSGQTFEQYLPNILLGLEDIELVNQ